MAKILLEMRDITKTFPGVKALSNVNLKVEEGEIHALVGENGAGKSTLMNLTRLRIEHAKELLSTTQYSMKEIGVMSGYSDPNYFSKSFKKNVGVTPTEYREGK